MNYRPHAYQATEGEYEVRQEIVKSLTDSVICRCSTLAMPDNVGINRQLKALLLRSARCRTISVIHRTIGSDDDDDGYRIRLDWNPESSYALWNYLSTPFLFMRPGFGLRELEPHEEGGDIWRRLLVKFPSDIPTHSDEQTFYFNEKGLLQRVDYVTDVVGGIAAHYCYDHLSFGGIVFPTLRRVVTRKESHSFLSNPTAVLLLLSDIFVA